MAVNIHFYICQALAQPLRKQLYQAPVSKILLASPIVSGLVVVYGVDSQWGSLWMVIHSVSTPPNFVSATPSMGILFPIQRRNEVSTRWFSLYLIFSCFAYCILGSIFLG
jgi:hypothetical protein